LGLGILFAQKEALVMDPTNDTAPVVQPVAMQEQPVDLIDLGSEEPVAAPLADEEGEK